MGVNTVCAQSEGQHGKVSQFNEVLNTTSVYGSDVCTSRASPIDYKVSLDGSQSSSSTGVEAPRHEISSWDPSLERYWEAEEGMGQIEGRLKAHLSYWEQTLQPAPWIISCIRDGYKLPPSSEPNKLCKYNQQSATRNS